MAKLALLFLAAGIFGLFVSSGPNRGAYDFQAFYCAGAAVRAHADPYRTQPLGECEHGHTDGTYAQLPRGVVLPAPQPGYDMAAFAAVSALPFDRAKALWGAFVTMALAVAIACAVWATGAPLGVAVAAFIASLVMPALAFGELFAFFAAATCAAMYFASRERWTAAGVCAALSLVEPHLGLPVCVGLAIWKPQTRAALSLTAAALGALAVGTLGAAPALEYVTRVLPLHALAEISSDAQLSLSAVLHAAGVPDALAVQIGTLSYAVAAIAGIALSRTLATRLRNDGFLVAVPAAFAIIGGSFIHVTEFFAAIPLALLLLACDPSSKVTTTALVLLAVPWFTAVEPGNVLALALLGAAAAFYLVWRRENEKLLAAFAAAGFAFAVLLAAPHFAAGNAPGTLAPTPIAGDAYPQASWQAWNYRMLSTASATVWALRAFSWTGLALLVWSAAARRSTPSAG